MTQKEKLLSRVMRSPSSLSFEDFQTLLKHSGWIFDHQTGSHQIWYSPQKCRLSIQDNKGSAKPYQIKQFLQQQEKEKKNV